MNILESIAQGKVFIIAEIGKNFIQTKEEQPVEVYIENAKKLIDAAVEAGADAVKFQTHTVEDEQMNLDVTSPHFKGSDRYNWVTRNTKATPKKFWLEIREHAKKRGIIFFSTPMSRGAAKFLDEIGVDLWKVGSGDVLDFVTLDYLAKTGKPIVISSGMSTIDEIDTMMNFLKKRNASIVLLHCVSKYPCPPEELHLKTINFLKKRYDVPIGFSDHSIGYESSVAAVHLGAQVIEKHFSFDRDLYGSDHKVSITSEEFKEMVKHIREKTPMEVSGYGSEAKILQEGEAAFRPLFRKALVAGRDLPEGTILESEMIYAMRPQAYIDGLPSEWYEEVVGKKLKRPLSKYQPIKREDIE